MKIIIYQIIVLSILVAVSCSDPEPTGTSQSGDVTSVFIRLNTIHADTRDGEPSQAGASAPLYTAIIYFLDDADDPLIWKVVTVAPSGATVTPAQLQTGVGLIAPSQSTQVYIIGNWNSSDGAGNYPDLPVDPGLRLSDIESTILDIDQVNYWQFADGTYAPDRTLVTVMNGRADLVNYSDDPGGWGGAPGPAGDDRYASVTLVPLMARIEVNTISMEEVDNMTLEGLYVDNFSPELPITLDTDGYPLVYYGSDAGRYDDTAPSFGYTPYRTMYIPVKFDYTYTGSGYTTALFTAPSTLGSPQGSNFTFQVFGNSPVPRIIVRMLNVSTGTGTYPQRYGTIKGFRDDQGNEINTFVRNTIYYIDIVRFDMDNTGPVPDADDIWVNVRVVPWVDVQVDPYN